MFKRLLWRLAGLACVPRGGAVVRPRPALHETNKTQLEGRGWCPPLNLSNGGFAPFNLPNRGSAPLLNSARARPRSTATLQHNTQARRRLAGRTRGADDPRPPLARPCPALPPLALSLALCPAWPCHPGLALPPPCHHHMLPPTQPLHHTTTPSPPHLHHHHHRLSTAPQHHHTAAPPHSPPPCRQARSK